MPFLRIVMVCDEAVNCRNHYMHGGDAPFDYGNNFDTVTFFTDTLEIRFWNFGFNRSRMGMLKAGLTVM
jgi:hypothetical protein